MSRWQRLWALAFVLCLLGMARSGLAFTVTATAQFDVEAQQFYMALDLPECDYWQEDRYAIQRGNLTQYITLSGVERYAASRAYRYSREVALRGTFQAHTTYTITVDGAICQRPGTATITVTTPIYPPAIEFLSKGLYFSRIEPYLRFRYREVSDISWTIYRITKENRYLFSRTEHFKMHKLQTSGETERLRQALPSLSYLEDYPGQRFTTASHLVSGPDWQVGALDLRPYYKEGDWLVIVAALPATPRQADANGSEAQETEADTGDSEQEVDSTTDSGSMLANTVLQFTNLGLYVRQNDTALWGQTVALDTGTPVFATVLFKQKNGEVLARIDTDVQGQFHLSDADLSRVKPQLQRIEAIRGEDSVEIFVAASAIPLKEFPITGADQRRPMQAFVYSDRGLYRLGETVHLTTLIRQWDLQVPPSDLSAELLIEGPAGRATQVTLPGTTFQNGAATWSWSIPPDSKTGHYRAEVQRQGTVIGMGTFDVEQIIPPTLEAEVYLQEPYASWDAERALLSPIHGTVTARFLFGAAAAGKKWEYRCVLEAGQFTPPRYDGFVFHDPLKVFQPLTFFQEEDGTLDSDGKGTLSCTQSDKLPPEVVLENLSGIGSIRAVVDVFEEGGRSVQTSRAIPGYVHAVYPGIRPMFTGNLTGGQPAAFQLVALDPTTGQPRAGVKLKVELYEKDYWSWYYFHPHGQPAVEAELTRVLRQAEEIVSGAEPVPYSITPPGCCEWELRVSVADTAPGSRVAFRNGWWWQQDGPGGAVPMAHKVTLQADKEQYTVGDTAKVLITAPFDGVLTLLHEKDGQLLRPATVSVVNRTATYEFTATQEHVPWFHLNAILLRTVQTTPSGFQAKRETPYRALGMLPLQVHAPEQRLTLALQAPQQVLPDSTLSLTLRAQDASGHDLPGPLWMTVAVVDEGILNLGHFATPDPYAGLHRRPAYPHTWFDTFGQVVPYSLHQGESAFGGDESLERRTVERVKPMAWWSGMVQTDASGVLTLDVPVQDYTGRVRVMAVGWQEQRTGSAQAQTLVFAPVDLLTSLPRVLGVFDRSQAVAEVLNNTASAQTVTVSCHTNGPLQLADAATATLTLQVPARQSRTVRWEIAGSGVPGKAEVTFVAQTADSFTRKRSTELVVRPVGTPLTLVTPFLIRGGESQLVHLPAEVEFADGTGEWEVTLSTSPAVRLAHHLPYLVGYPHGCIEQTTSRLFAMLMLKPTLGSEVLARYVRAKTVSDIDIFLEAGLQKLAKMQMADGGFAYWLGASTQYPWLNAYATHFLWKARQLGYAVADEMYTRALQKLQEQFTGNRTTEPDVMAYSAFVLALNGQVSKGDLQWLVSRLQGASAQPEHVTLAVGQALARATMLRLKQPPVALAALQGLPEVTLDTPALWWWRGHSFLSREGAFAAQLYSRALADDASVGSPLQLLLQQLAEQPYVSTHTIAWALVATDSAFPAATEVVKARVTTPAGSAHEITTAAGANQLRGPFTGPDTRGFTMSHTASHRPLFGYLTAHGWPLRPPREGLAQRLELHRLYLDEAGRLLMPPLTVKQGQRLFVALLARHTVEGMAELANVVIEDWLPAGFELENLRLLAADALPELPQAWRNSAMLQPDFIDYLDDKLSVFGTLTREFRAFIFPVRAVSQGTFQLMPSTAEAMYMPDVRAVHVANSQIIITPAHQP